MNRFYQTSVWSVILLIMLVAAGCSNSNKPANNAASAEATVAPTPEASVEPATRAYKDATGKELQIPSQPQKIAAINYVGDLLALGVKPAYTTDYNLTTYGELLSGAKSVGDRPVNVESVTAAAPDLIITDDTGDDSEYSQLAKIAPTAKLAFWSPDPYEHLNSLATMLGKEEEAASWISAYEAKAKTAKDEIGKQIQPGETGLLLIVSGQDMGVSGVRNGGFTLYRQLGFTPPAKLQPLLDKDENFGWETVTLEGLADINPDHLFVEMDDASEVTKQTFDKLMKSEVLKGLNASKKNQIYTVTNQWGLGDATSLNAQLDEALAQFKK
ncbi:ABC transporter substrate-binding protein [Paenibacillus sp. JDR-2]|uniref:ABC transporter substrate-binding protein n=1 Tax=Paenibacillus sp. (strain JDR-2) TaxID=324057 RepID=UPI0001666796|nr:ABC transporter substrate-binding protein [Paenibacillus sp. JDR-2]ACT02237.1 periplasmic binding protein [Paenibacillus sp. JDR-2]